MCRDSWLCWLSTKLLLPLKVLHEKKTCRLQFHPKNLFRRNFYRQSQAHDGEVTRARVLIDIVCPRHLNFAAFCRARLETANLNPIGRLQNDCVISFQEVPKKASFSFFGNLFSSAFYGRINSMPFLRETTKLLFFLFHLSVSVSLWLIENKSKMEEKKCN